MFIIVFLEIVCNFDKKKPIVHCLTFSAIISKFALETIVLLTALIRKQRIVIYHHDIDDLVKYVLSVPFMSLSTASTWDYVYPWVGYNDEELGQFAVS